jgi:peptide/nickel transport system permease protein
MSGAFRSVLAVFVGSRLAGTSTIAPARRGPADRVDLFPEPTRTKGEGVRFVLHFLNQDKAALAGLAVVAVFLGYGLVEGIAQWVGELTRHPQYGWAILPSNPIALNFPNSLAPPSTNSLASIFGYNYLGQSILSGLLYATPHDAVASIVVVASGIFFGALVGIPAGYIGGWFDDILMRVTDAFLAFPYLILAIVLSVILGNGFTIVLVVLVIIWWPTYARYFRGQTVSLKSRGFVEASKLNGVGGLGIMARHIFPNSIDPIIAQATLDFGSVIVLYSSLAFLGIGVQPGYPEWGSMTSDGLPFFPQIWWWSVVPGIVITVVVVAFTLIGDRIQDLVGGRLTY